jgi:hypothetical protein
MSTTVATPGHSNVALRGARPRAGEARSIASATVLLLCRRMTNAHSFVPLELRRMEFYKAPRDKLVCLMRCFNSLTGTFLRNLLYAGECSEFMDCFYVADLLRKARKQTAPRDAGFVNADEILPVLIYTCLQSAPEHLHLNLVPPRAWLTTHPLALITRFGAS